MNIMAPNCMTDSNKVKHIRLEGLHLVTYETVDTSEGIDKGIETMLNNSLGVSSLMSAALAKRMSKMTVKRL